MPLRHEKYRTQYRAMFVMNCIVKQDEVLRYKAQQDKKQRNRKRRKGQRTESGQDEAVGLMPEGMDADEVYHPVKCSECSTEVAVFDKDEVYHFFNILASHCWDTMADLSNTSPSAWREWIPLRSLWAHGWMHKAGHMTWSSASFTWCRVKQMCLLGY